MQIPIENFSVGIFFCFFLHFFCIYANRFVYCKRNQLINLPMKRIAFILMVLCTLSFISCSYDKDEVSYNENAKSVSIPSPIESFIDKFIVMENSRYVITASLDDALSLGLTEAEFIEISKEIEKGNQMIAEIVDYYSQCEDVTSITIIDLNKAPKQKDLKTETRAEQP